MNKLKLKYSPNIIKLGAIDILTILVNDINNLKLQYSIENIDEDILTLLNHELHHIYQYRKFIRYFKIFGHLIYWLYAFSGIIIPYSKKRFIEISAYKVENEFLSPIAANYKINIL